MSKNPGQGPTSTTVPAAGQGVDVGKRIVGRKRSIVIDALGLLLAVLVTAASVQDSIAGPAFIEKAAADHEPGATEARMETDRRAPRLRSSFSRPPWW